MQNEFIQDNLVQGNFVQAGSVQDGDPIACSPEMMRARGVLETVKRAGLMLIPPEPSDEMVEAGVAVSGIGADRVRAVFRAMIAAADIARRMDTGTVTINHFGMAFGAPFAASSRIVRSDARNS